MGREENIVDKFFVETSIKKIKEASKNNKLVVFVGAGVSANSGVPTWGELVKEMAKDLGEFNLEKSQDLYLKIPQYYFNERGEKEYFEKLNEFFLNQNYKTNALHKEILKLEPTHFITTNYDTLLEEAAIEAGSFYHTVKQDYDLPYNNLNKTIIKMHGDFTNRNIVLKEDDYLSYSANFTLIENYIKSLIATNTVVFIGYSVNDPNFNLIFQWVKSILKSHFQPAYLIDSNNTHSAMELAYYKNRGINILHYEAMGKVQENKMFIESNWRGNRLFDILKYFNTYDVLKNIKEIDNIYSKLSYFEKLNFIMPSQIIKSLELESVGYDLYGNKTLDVLEANNILTKVFSNAEEKDLKGNWEKTVRILNKANIKGVSRGQEIIWKNESNNTYLHSITKEIIDRDSLLTKRFVDYSADHIKDGDYFYMLKQAYAYYEEEKFLEAYKYYKNISLKSFYDKEFLIYFLSEFNRKHVGRLLIRSSFNRIDEHLVSEINELDLEEIFLRLPYKDRKSLEFIKELQDFTLIYKAQNSLRKEVEELKKAKRTIENGGISFNNSLYRQYNIINNIWLFIKANYLCIDKYQEVQNLYLNFIEGVFVSYSTKSESNSTSIFSDVKVDKIEELDLFAVYIIITKLKSKELENLFLEYNLKDLKIKAEGLIYLNEVLEVIINNISENKNLTESKKLLFNSLILVSNINMDGQLVNTIAEKLLIIFNEKIYVDDLKYINKFIVSVSNQETIKREMVLKYLETYLKVFEQNRNILDYDTKGLFNNLIIVYKNYDDFSDFTLEKTLISRYLRLINQLYNEEKYLELLNILEKIILSILDIISLDQKREVLITIEKLINKLVEKEESLSAVEMLFYFRAVFVKASPPKKLINKKIIESTITLMKDQNNGVKSYPDPLERNLNIITDLFRMGYLQRNEIEKFVKDLKGYSQYFDLIFTSDYVDLKSMDFINILNESEISNIMKDEIMAETVYSLFESSMFNLKSKKERDIFNKLYLKRFNS